MKIKCYAICEDFDKEHTFFITVHRPKQLYLLAEMVDRFEYVI